MGAVAGGLVVLVAVVVGYEVLGPSQLPVLTVLLAPITTAIVGGPRATALLGALASVVVLVLSVLSETISPAGVLVRLLTSMAVAGVAIFLVRQREQRELRLAEGRTLNQLRSLTVALARAVSPADVAEVMLVQGRAAVGAETALVYVLAEGEMLELLGSTGYEADELAPFARVPVDETLPVTDVLRRHATLVLDRRTLERDYPRLSGGTRLRSQQVVGVPLDVDGNTLGVAFFGSQRTAPLSEHERGLARALADQCAQALQRSLLYEASVRSEDNLRTLQEVTAELADAYSADAVADVLLDQSLGRLGAVGAALTLADREGEGLRQVATSGFPGGQTSGWVPVAREAPSPLARCLASGDIVVREISEPPAAAADLPGDGGGEASAIWVPIPGRRGPEGVLAYVFAEERRFDKASRELFASIAAQCGQALERARLYAAEHAVADTLQRSLLPALPPRVGRLELQGRYRPGTVGTQVGGDWFDALLLPGERVCLVVGDVEGRGVSAAATMGQLRAALRALTATHADPAVLLQLLNETQLGADRPMVTLAIIVVDRTGQATYAYAGHPPIFARFPDGTVRALGGGRGVPLGVVNDATFRSAQELLPAGTMVAMYTDGLVERRDVPIDHGLDRLAATLGDSSSLLSLADRLLELVDERDQTDDVALLVAEVTLDDHRLVFPPLRNLAEIRPMRAALGDWLRDHGATEDDVFAVTLAVAEVAVNSLQHAYPLTGGSVEIDATVAEGRLVARIVDHGSWRTPDPARGGGRGLVMLRSLVDADVVTGAGGTTVSIERELGVRR